MSDPRGEVVAFPGGGGDPSLVGAIEALLFAAGAPVPVARLLEVLPGRERREVQGALEALGRRYQAPESGLSLEEIAGGWQLRTDARFAEAVGALMGGKTQRLSKAALEVLAIAAYRQPVTRKEIEDLRGVASGAVVRSLLERGLLRVGSRRDEPGRPLEYRTTALFLELFSLGELRDLPTLRERRELD
ncbi:MAG: SMC-Scp complex subunit ScpB [Deltaproteobacteria bacterium]|nr:SMC-Scp complex subunit ScpB [Deltaproteobacteria bacterium]